MKSHNRIVRCSSLALVLLSVGSMLGQADVILRGTITDPAGSAVSGMDVQLTRAGQPVELARSSAGGVFRFAGVAPGTYRVETPAFRGLAPQQITVQISASTAPLAIVLAPATVVQTIQVDAGQTLSTAAADNQDSVVVTAAELNNLPVFDQDIISTLTPFLDPGDTSSAGVSIVVDGVELKGPTVTPSAIAEVRINSDPYSAEYSSPGRGRIEITSKSGSPEYHGTLNFIFRDSIFNARNYFAPVRPPEQRRIYEGNLTGPVGHGGKSTFLLSATEREEDLQSAVHAAGPPGELGFDANGNLSENASTPSRRAQANGRVSHDFSSTHRASLAYNYEYETYRNSGVGGTVLPSAGTDTEAREDDLIFNDRLILSPNLIQQLAIVAEKDEDLNRSVTNAPSIRVQGAFTAGGAQYDVARTENTIHLTDIVSYTHKRHYVRFGFSSPFQLSRRVIDDHSNRLGSFSFNSIPDFQNRTPYQFTVQQGIGRGIFWLNQLDGFAQDEISLTPHLQVTAGLRYQWQTYLSDHNNFAPRLSFAYSPGKRWVVRAGSGIFYDRIGADFSGTFKVQNGVVLRQFQILNPGYPDALGTGADYAALPVSLVRESPGLHAPLLVEYTASVERQLLPGLTATAAYRGITGTHRFRSRDANAPLPPSYAVRPDPSLGFVQQVESEGRSRMNALDLTLQGKVGRWFAGRAEYTLSRSDDNTDGVGWFPQNQFAPSDEWGRSILDRRHRFNLLGTVHPDHWLSLGLATYIFSGAPYNEIAGSDFFHTGLGNARPEGLGRNTLQGSGRITVDVSWNHDIPLDRSHAKDRKVLNLGISAFNILNHANSLAGDYVGNVRSPLFGQATTTLPGRQLQFQARYEF